MRREDQNCAEAIEAVAVRGAVAENKSGDGNDNVVVVKMGSAASSLPAADTRASRRVASDLGAILREPGGEDVVEMELDGKKWERKGGDDRSAHHPPVEARRASSTSSSTSFASAAETGPAEEEGRAPRQHSSRILFDGALVDESKLREDKCSPELVLSDEETAASASSSTVGSVVDSAGAAISASIEECVEHGEDGLKCAYPGSNGRCRHSMYGSPLPAEEVLERMGPEWAAAAVGRARGGTEGMPVGAGSGGIMDGGGGLVWHVRIVPDDYNHGGTIKYLTARDFDAENGRIKPRRGTKIPVTATDFFSSLVRIEGRGARDIGAAARNRVSADQGGIEAASRHEERLWGMWDGNDGGESGNSDHGSDTIFRDDGSNRLDILPTVDDIPLIGPRLALYLQTQSEAAPPCRYVFSGVLNGWPGLTTLELLSIQCRGKIPRWSTRWSHDVHGRAGLAPSFPEDMQEVRATLRAPPWSAHGWSQTSPGFVFWYEPEDCRPPGAGDGDGDGGARLRYGTDIAAQVEEDRAAGLPAPRCRRVHMVSHRYARGVAKKESSKDRLTYHSVILLEWDHGRHCTVVEGAFLNGIGGYAGRSNWCYDEPGAGGITGLYRALPPEMVMPWKSHLSEIRCIDVPARNLDEFKSFMARHGGHEGRFVDPHYTFSHDVRLTFRSKDHIATYLLNYIRRDRTYSEIRRNCQTFAADLCGFLAGKRDVQPFHPVNQVRYSCRKHHFLYESDMYG